MTDKITSQRVICQGGLNTNQNYLELSQLAPGYATMLVNYESSLTGGYRRINGFAAYAADYPEVTSMADPAEGAILGVFGYKTSTVFTVFACRKLQSGNEYGIYRYTGSGWELETTGTTQNSLGVLRVRAEVFSTQTETVIIFVDGINKALAYNGTTWYQLSSSNSGGSGSPGGNQVLDAPSLVGVFKNHIFLSGDPSYPSVVAFSSPENNGGYLTWTAALGGGQMNPSFEVQQIKPFRDEMYIFGKSGIKKAVPDSASGFILQDVTSNIGCIARDSVFELAGNLVFLSSDGLRIVAGTANIGDVELSSISQNIHNTFTDIQDKYDMDDLKAVVIREKTQFRLFIGNSEFDVSQSYGVIGSLRIRDSVMWEYGELKGIRASACWSGYNLTREIVLHGDYDGCVYQQEVGNSFNNEPITAIFRSPYLDQGDTEVRKTIRTVNTFIRATGSFDLALGLKFDWDNLYKINPVNYNETSTGNTITYDSGFKYDQGHKYGSVTQPIIKTNVEGTGWSTQLTYVSEGIFAPYTIQGYVIEFTPNGRN